MSQIVPLFILLHPSRAPDRVDLEVLYLDRPFVNMVTEAFVPALNLIIPTIHVFITVEHTATIEAGIAGVDYVAKRIKDLTAALSQHSRERSAQHAKSYCDFS
jgi:hypothetical protein